MTFLLITCATLLVGTAGLTIKATVLSAQVTTLTVRATASVVENRKAIAAAVARAKAKARLRRLIAVIPLAGIGAVGYFERQDFVVWQEDNPEGNIGDYSCEVATVSADVMDEVLHDLPELVRPSRNFVLSKLPECIETND